MHPPSFFPHLLTDVLLCLGPVGLHKFVGGVYWRIRWLLVCCSIRGKRGVDHHLTGPPNNGARIGKGRSSKEQSQYDCPWTKWSRGYSAKYDASDLFSRLSSSWSVVAHSNSIHCFEIRPSGNPRSFDCFWPHWHFIIIPFVSPA